MDLPRLLLSPLPIWSGNILWSYNPGLAGVLANPIKLLPNGHFLVNFSGVVPDGANSVLQEVDLTGKADLANDSSGPQQSAGSGNLRRLQYHSHWDTPRLRACFPTGT